MLPSNTETRSIHHLDTSSPVQPRSELLQSTRGKIKLREEYELSFNKFSLINKKTPRVVFLIPLLSEEPIAIWLERNRKNTKESCWAEYVVENNVSQNEVVERNTLCKRELIVSLVIQGTRSTDPPRRCRKKKKKKKEISLVDHPGGNVVTMPSFLQVYGKEWISLS